MSRALTRSGDIIAQQVVERRGANQDFVRTARLTAYGGLVFTPIMSVWLNRVLDRVPIKNKWGAVVAKVRPEPFRADAQTALDQSIAAPVMTSVFLSSMTLAQGGGMREVKQELDQVRTRPAACADRRNGSRRSALAGPCGSRCRRSIWRLSRPRTVSCLCMCTAREVLMPQQHG